MYVIHRYLHNIAFEYYRTCIIQVLILVFVYDSKFCSGFVPNHFGWQKKKKNYITHPVRAVNKWLGGAHIPEQHVAGRYRASLEEKKIEK